MQTQTEMQTVNINNEKAPCIKCGANLVDISNFIFDGKVDTKPTFVEEHCKCKHCGTPFLMHYDLFDVSGHVLSKVFTEDINNVDYNWQDALTEEQRLAVSEHLKHCDVCLDRLSQEMLTDAWLKSLITGLHGKLK